jgi:hypothetical protein
MDGHLRAFDIFVGEIHAPEFTDCYYATQQQFITRLLKPELTLTRGMQRKTCFHLDL